MEIKITTLRGVKQTIMLEDCSDIEIRGISTLPLVKVRPLQEGCIVAVPKDEKVSMPKVHNAMYIIREQ